MNINANIFKEYDIRGVVERDFSAELITALGRAFATWVSRQNGKTGLKIAVGRDVRLSSPDLFAWLTKGLEASGVTVIDLGVCPTPLTYFSLFHLDVDGAVMITGSHNPKEYNGFKLCYAKTTLYGRQIQDIQALVREGAFISGRGARRTYDIVTAYQAYQMQRHNTLSKASQKLKVVVDAGNGTAGAVVPPLLRALGCNVVELFCDADGNFPNHHPDPTIPGNLRDLIERVKAEKADVGFSFDGDADRLGLVDETGRILFGDEIMILLARDIATRHKGAKIIGEVKCSKRMYDEIAKAGAEPIMWKTGHSLIKTKMKEEHALLAGEMSGHLFFSEEYFGYDDALHAALEVACILSRSLAATGRGIAALMADVPPAIATPEIRTDCADEVKFKVVQAVREMVERYAASQAEPRVTNMTTIDGVRADFADGWGLVRASNTQPILVSRYEAGNAASLASYQRFFEGLIQEAMDAAESRPGKACEKTSAV